MSLLRYKTYKVTRYLPGTRNSNERGFSDGGTNTFYIKGNIQPLSGDDMVLLFEGKRTSETRWLYTDRSSASKLRTSSIDGKYNADVVHADGINFEVQSTKDWNQLSTNVKHFKVLLVADSSSG